MFATTYLAEAERADRLFLLGEGKLLAQGTAAEVIAQTPGAIWQAPVTATAAQDALDASNVWRRAATVFQWEQDDTAPNGFERAPADLENSSIALLLARTPASRAIIHREHRPTALTAATLVSAQGVTRRYGTFTALEDVTLRVDSGEVAGLLGGNGAGKTTLMRVLLGLERPTDGTAELFGERPSLATRRRVGYVAQGLGLYPALSATENLEFSASVHGVAVSRQAFRYARTFGHSPVGVLPLGAKRMLAYLAATAHDPELLILDEPTSGMDALARARLWRDLRTTADAGTGILVTTHYMQEAAQCDRLVMLNAARIIAEGTVAQLTTDGTSLDDVMLRGAQHTP